MVVNEPRPLGLYTVQWDGSAFPNGGYFYTQRVGGFFNNLWIHFCGDEEDGAREVSRGDRWDTSAVATSHPSTLSVPQSRGRNAPISSPETPSPLAYPPFNCDLSARDPRREYWISRCDFDDLFGLSIFEGK